jgi:hypothetical protein
MRGAWLPQGVEGVLNKVVYAEEEDWAGLIKGAAQQVGVQP